MYNPLELRGSHPHDFVHLIQDFHLNILLSECSSSEHVTIGMGPVWLKNMPTGCKCITWYKSEAYFSFEI